MQSIDFIIVVIAAIVLARQPARVSHDPTGRVHSRNLRRTDLWQRRSEIVTDKDIDALKQTREKMES